VNASNGILNVSNPSSAFADLLCTPRLEIRVVRAPGAPPRPRTPNLLLRRTVHRPILPVWWMIVVWCDGTPIPTHQDSMSDLTSTGREREAEPEGDSNPSGDRPLTPRQQRFVDEYLIDSNGTQAAIRAGYSAHTAASQAERLLRNVEIVRAVSVGRAAIAERNKVKVDDIIAEYVRIAFSDPRNYDLDPDTGQLRTRDGADPSVWRAISSVKRKIRRYPHGHGDRRRIPAVGQAQRPGEARQTSGAVQGSARPGGPACSPAGRTGHTP
jgi:hypothetical protein